MKFLYFLLMLVVAVVCHKKDKPPACFLPKVVGPCKAHMPKFYYDSCENKCLPFVYGGCSGNDNRFDCIEACEGACGPCTGEEEPVEEPVE